MSGSYVESSFVKPDVSFEVPLRPQTLKDFTGQVNVRERLEVMCGAALQRGEVLGHCLFSGPPGLGKTTLSHILANTMGGKLIVTSGPVLEIPGDLAGILTSLEEGDLLFIDEIHRLPRGVEEYLYPAMEDFTLDLVIDKGPCSRTVQTKLNRFTLVGATTRMGAISAPLRSRFGGQFRLDYYASQDLLAIAQRTARILSLEAPAEALEEVANRARGTPRIVNNLLRWVRDYAQMKTNGELNREIVASALSMLNIDEIGLDEMDERILSVIIDNYDGGPVGVSTIAVGVGEEVSTIEEVHEPYLIMQGLIKRTPRGREATALAIQHLTDKRG